ncbi:hypothetical protein [Spirosoma sp.]|uniref:hypothetical protein n=1 Tax=Spirosoma sp. TaxID=1899569 RepID=UPI003B3A0F32
MIIETKYNPNDKVWFVDATGQPTEAIINTVMTLSHLYPKGLDTDEWVYKTEVTYELTVNGNTGMHRKDDDLYSTSKDCYLALAAAYAERALYYQNLGNAPVIG